ncbi:hypothetical protein [Sphingomonas xinjiangensis]|uniref:Glycosyltransferase RgtA/B/C/D-like domain-containing protein n=1 Tax=Sphingomonas xinjiangensis TaxID=643568 RepID=A0A840YH60_9SPHN|nr:hypothetical protein [Sphingomonas xinjiangensis]MBB5712224.1 hypothetical protein [Sphingomonas xinjiangensis]
MNTGETLHWWQTRWFVALCTLMALVPLLWPDVPPLVDLPGHMGRYRVQFEYDQAPWLREWYDFQWSLMGNLGVDLLVIPLHKLFGLELAVKLIIITIPAMTVAGLLMIAREVHGRIPATALFALPLAYSFPFHFGFVNFAMSMALALIAFGWWLRLARLGRLKLRAVLFVPISATIWVCHTYGWGMLGLLAFSAELVRQHDLAEGQGFARRWLYPWFWTGMHCLVLAPPALLMVLWRSGGHVTGQTGNWFNWRAKTLWVVQVFRDRWQLFDLASLGVLFLLMFKAVRDPNIQYSRNLTLSALFLLAVYILLPRIVFGSAYADMRLVPFMLAIAIIGIRPKPGMSMRGAALVAAIGMAFFTARIGATAYSFFLYDKAYDRELKALDHLPRGARLITFVGETCYNEWRMTRVQHLPGLALERKLAYANDQWSMAGGQLLTVRYAAAGRFAHDPSELVTDVQCPREWWRPIPWALTRFPRDAFDYVWLVRPPAYDPRFLQGLVPVWRDGTSGLFRVDHRVPAPVIRPGELPVPRSERDIMLGDGRAPGRPVTIPKQVD